MRVLVRVRFDGLEDVDLGDLRHNVEQAMLNEAFEWGGRIGFFEVLTQDETRVDI